MENSACYLNPPLASPQAHIQLTSLYGPRSPVQEMVLPIIGKVTATSVNNQDIT